MRGGVGVSFTWKQQQTCTVAGASAISWPVQGIQVSLSLISVAMEQQPGVDNRNAGAYRAGTP